MSQFSERVWAAVEACQRGSSEEQGFALSADAPEPTAMSLCLAVLIAELYGLLDSCPRGEWADILLRLQDAESGLFVDPRFRPEDLTPSSPGREYLLLQTTYFAVNALDALGRCPQHPLHFASPYVSEGYIERWMEELNWPNPWRESNMVMFIAAALYQRQCEGDASAALALQRMLDWLEAQQDADSGLWGTRSGASLLEAMAAAYHFLPFYFVLGRPVHHAERIIDSTLSLQQPDGLFHPAGGGDTCLDVDAIDLLVKCSLLTAHRRAEVEAALERAYHGLLRNQDDDGGFCRARERPYPPKSRKRRIAEATGLDRLLGRPYKAPREVWYYSGWTKMPFDIRRSDLWSTWFRSFGLGLISTHLADRFPSKIKWTFRRLPALGWHDPACVRAIGTNTLTSAPTRGA